MATSQQVLGLRAEVNKTTFLRKHLSLAPPPLVKTPTLSPCKWTTTRSRASWFPFRSTCRPLCRLSWAHWALSFLLRRRDLFQLTLASTPCLMVHLPLRRHRHCQHSLLSEQLRLVLRLPGHQHHRCYYCRHLPWRSRRPCPNRPWTWSSASH